MPVSLSPERIAACIGAAPRQRGNKDAWTLRQPCFGRSRITCGNIDPYAATIIKSACKSEISLMTSVSLSDSGWHTIMFSRSANSLTALALTFLPRPAGRSGCVKTASGMMPES